MYKKIAVPNRGTVAARIVRALRELSIKSVVLCSEADKDNPYVKQADEFIVIGPPTPKESYLNHESVIKAALDSGCEAIHPGYGFLSEDPEFAKKVLDNGLGFIGPTPYYLKLMGDKVLARNEMYKKGFPLTPYSKTLTGTFEEQAKEARKVGFPLMIKPSHGGGGIGMIPVFTEDKLINALESAANQAERGFGKRDIYVERMLTAPRHIEFQVVSDGVDSVHLFDRDCSIQRRRQKVIEEAGAPLLPLDVIKEMALKASHILGEIGYNHLGTVETLYSSKCFGFLEVNPRLQVEHAVTEEVTGVDLVKTQIKLSCGQKVPDIFAATPVLFCGHSIEARIYAEDSKKFYPSPGPLKVFQPPRGYGIRIETGFEEGNIISPYYDPMIAQVIVHAPDREKAIDLLYDALCDFPIEGIKTNLGFLKAMLQYPPYREGNIHTGLTDELINSKSYNPG
jgi:acetyl-CoA carboxylase biotin carboxylase subunit